MTETLNFNEFYQKSPIPISENDRFSIQKDVRYEKVFKHFTHWLIALEGSDLGRPNQNYQWRVVIYPADEFGAFNFKYPFFRSTFMTSFNEAFEFSKEIEMKAKQDQLMMIQY
jgi:hypothetical protein